ncbi:hypothetical protein FISHEDRAFT_68774 [Fistulina hepatica ATCC 64428]|uniref:Uncharacterized protein n=1 Tax=Fistulina hepatica ATCC 64428 TaxID=1128425 RepID=A0A0D7AP66_9AGAR|nr:hypothetical protein FISHEDRAFT_68774 [Fistulina hepatica ATCC 64428]
MANGAAIGVVLTLTLIGGAVWVFTLWLRRRRRASCDQIHDLPDESRNTGMRVARRDKYGGWTFHDASGRASYMPYGVRDLESDLVSARHPRSPFLAAATPSPVLSTFIASPTVSSFSPCASTTSLIPAASRREVDEDHGISLSNQHAVEPPPPAYQPSADP